MIAVKKCISDLREEVYIKSIYSVKPFWHDLDDLLFRRQSCISVPENLSGCSLFDVPQGVEPAHSAAFDVPRPDTIGMACKAHAVTALQRGEPL